MKLAINISLPEPVVNNIRSAVKKGRFSSTGAFIKKLLNDWQEEKLLAELEESRKDILEGKGKVLKSLKDLR